MHIKNPSVLVIEDNLAIRRFLKISITSQHYQYIEANNGNTGLELAMENKPNIVLLDLGLPDIDGLEVINELRVWTATPIIILSARDQEQDKIKALDCGADDYITKPFTVGELHARLRVALRHVEHINESETPIFLFDNFKVDLVNRECWSEGKLISLTPIQFSILAFLIRKVNKIVTHKQLLKEVWGDSHTQDLDYLRVYIHQLRHKIEDNPSRPIYLKTEPGIGYRLIVKSS